MRRAGRKRCPRQPYLALSHPHRPTPAPESSPRPARAQNLAMRTPARSAPGAHPHPPSPFACSLAHQPPFRAPQPHLGRVSQGHTAVEKKEAGAATASDNRAPRGLPGPALPQPHTPPPAASRKPTVSRGRRHIHRQANESPPERGAGTHANIRTEYPPTAVWASRRRDRGPGDSCPWPSPKPSDPVQQRMHRGGS